MGVGKAGLIGGLHPDRSITIHTMLIVDCYSFLGLISTLPITSKIFPFQLSIQMHKEMGEESAFQSAPGFLSITLHRPTIYSPAWRYLFQTIREPETNFAFSRLYHLGAAMSTAIGVGHLSIRTINYFDKNTESMVYSVTHYSGGTSTT